MEAAAKQFARSVDIFWFVARGDTLKGPFTSEQLLQAIESEKINHFDFCWRQGFREWRPISSVPDFDRRSPVHGAPNYPTISPPVNESFLREIAASGAAEPPKLTKNIRISFARSPRTAISIYEWGLAILFALAFAYIASSFALNEVKRNLTARMELAMLGYTAHIGNAKRSVPPEVWNPLYSAPGLSETTSIAQDHSTLFTDAARLDFSLPVTIVGHASSPETDTTSGTAKRSPASVGGAASHPGVTLAGYDLGDPSHFNLWHPQDFDLDPVYSSPLEVRGYLSAHDGNTLEVRQAGEPLLAY